MPPGNSGKRRNVMKEPVQPVNSNGQSKALLAIGALAAIGMLVMIIREVPALRREMRLMRM